MYTVDNSSTAHKQNDHTVMEWVSPGDTAIPRMYDQSQGRRPSTLKCIGSNSQSRYNRAPTSGGSRGATGGHAPPPQTMDKFFSHLVKQITDRFFE